MQRTSSRASVKFISGTGLLKQQNVWHRAIENWHIWLGLRQGVFTYVGWQWQVTLCDPDDACVILTLHSSEMHRRRAISFNFNFNCFMLCTSFIKQTAADLSVAMSNVRPSGDDIRWPRYNSDANLPFSTSWTDRKTHHNNTIQYITWYSIMLLWWACLDSIIDTILTSSVKSAKNPHQMLQYSSNNFVFFIK